MFEALKAEAKRVGKPDWRPMLSYIADLHERSTHPATDPFPYPWEEIGPGYCYGPAFGHYDIIHAVLDLLPTEPEHARFQILNNLAAQEDDGLVPGVITMRKDTPSWKAQKAHPPVWPVAVDDYCRIVGSYELMRACYEPLTRQIGWFESNRKAEGVGFYYADIFGFAWESGVDEGIRYIGIEPGAVAAVDATAHMYLMYERAADWAHRLEVDGSEFRKEAERLQEYIQNELFDPETGFFHDSWSVGIPDRRVISFEGLWPVVVGAAREDQVDRIVDEYLLSPDHFYSEHPITTVSLADPRFELRMWRGPAWNSMTYWIVRGCMKYSKKEAAKEILERALHQSNKHFQDTGTVWEFYHPHGGSPLDVKRKPATEYNTPCRDYLGHNPLIGMARIWSTL